MSTRPSIEKKRCSACGKVKPVTEFYARSNQCKVCRKIVMDRWIAANREKLNANRRSQEENAGKVIERKRLYIETHREQIRERKRRYCEKNRDRLREYGRQYRARK